MTYEQLNAYSEWIVVFRQHIAMLREFSTWRGVLAYTAYPGEGQLYPVPLGGRYHVYKLSGVANDNSDWPRRY